MFPTIAVEGVERAYLLLHGIADRARDASPAWDSVADQAFAFERRYWQSNPFGAPSAATRDRDRTGGRDPRMMYVTGGLEASATRRGAARQEVNVRPDGLEIVVTHGLARIQENRGRQVLAAPTKREAREWVDTVGQYIITGRL